MRGRRYPWGTVNIEDKSHCDFMSLRTLVLAKHMQDLKDVTSQCHYEKYRCEKLTSLALNKEVGTYHTDCQMLKLQIRDKTFSLIKLYEGFPSSAVMRITCHYFQLKRD